jgi:hypothetical protein
MTRAIDLTGRRFGMLVAQKASNKYGRKSWVCVCDCGKSINAPTGHLNYGSITSCGCKRLSTLSAQGKKNATHGMRHSRLTNIYEGMRKRCYVKNDKSYSRYGGKGITICNEWLGNIPEFIKWAKSNGYDDKLQIDRINGAKGYSPDNCRWVDCITQQNNRISNLSVNIDGIVMTATQWARKFNVDPVLFRARLRRGWDPKIALSRPPRIMSRPI